MEKETVEKLSNETKKQSQFDSEDETQDSEGEYQDFMKGFQFEDEWVQEEKSATDEDEAEEKSENSSLANSEIGEEETEERLKESGQEYSKPGPLEDALAENYRPVITEGAGETNVFKSKG